MLDQALDLFDIQPDIDLDLMQPDQSLAALTARVFTHLDPVLERLLDDHQEHALMAQAVNPYRDGYAAERIEQAVVEYKQSLQIMSYPSQLQN